MIRQDVIAALVRMLRPLGPEGDPVQREEEESAWAMRAAGEARTMVELFELARNPPTAAERGRVSEEAFREQLAHVLSLAGVCNLAAVLDQVGALTQDPRARATAIEVIGALGDPAGLRWLVPLVDQGDLSDDEATWLASALGDIGTLEARALLERFAASTSREHVVVHREIQIARDAIARRTET